MPAMPAMPEPEQPEKKPELRIGITYEDGVGVALSHMARMAFDLSIYACERKAYVSFQYVEYDLRTDACERKAYVSF